MPNFPAVGCIIAAMTGGKTARGLSCGIIAFAGAGVSAVIAVAVVLLPEKMAADLLAVVAGCFSGAYFGFAMASESPRNTAINFAVALVFFAAALAGAWISPMFFAAACFCHAAWDIVITHPKAMNERIVWWYAPICVSCDIALGAFVIFWFW